MVIKNKPYKGLFILILITGLLIGCGLFGDSETEENGANEVSVVTATVKVIPTPTAEFIQEESAVLNLVQYDHPTGAFSIMIPADIVSDEGDFSAYFRITDTADLVIIFDNLGTSFTTQELSDYTDNWLDNMILGTDFAQSYNITHSETINDANITQYDFIHNSGKEGKGSLTLIQSDVVIYILDFTSFNFDADETLRAEIVDTLTLKPDKAASTLSEITDTELEAWRLDPYPDSQFIINEKEATPDWEEIVDYHATALSIPKPYFWDIYLLPDGTKYDEVKNHFRSVMGEMNYQQAMDKQWSKETYTLTYLHSVNKNSKNAVIFLGEYGERKPMAIIIYSNPQ